MLTQSERKWCKKRQKINNSPLQEPWVLAPEFMRMAFNEMHEAREAAEFEAMVAALLADIDFSPVADTRPWVRLKYARLAVEEEMNANRI